MYFKSSLVATRGRRPPWREMHFTSVYTILQLRAHRHRRRGHCTRRETAAISLPHRARRYNVTIIVIRLRRRLCNGLAWYAENGTEAVVTGWRAINEAASSLSSSWSSTSTTIKQIGSQELLFRLITIIIIQIIIFQYYCLLSLGSLRCTSVMTHCVATS